MNVGFVVLRNVVVKHVADPTDVQATSRNIGRDENVEKPGFELLDGSFASFLRHVSIQSDRLLAFFVQLLGDRDSHVLGIRKNDNAVRVFDVEQTFEYVYLFARMENQSPLPNRIGCHSFCFDRDPCRIIQVLLSDRANWWRKRGREQRDLAPLWRLLKDVFHVVKEAHVEHLVGFVEYQALEFAQVQRTTFDVVDDSARRSDNDFDTTFELSELSGVIAAAIDREDRESRQATCIR